MDENGGRERVCGRSAGFWKDVLQWGRGSPRPGHGMHVDDPCGIRGKWRSEKSIEVHVVGIDPGRTQHGAGKGQKLETGHVKFTKRFTTENTEQPWAATKKQKAIHHRDGTPRFAPPGIKRTQRF